MTIESKADGPMHRTIDHCPLCRGARFVRLQGKNYPCQECVAMIPKSSLRTIRYMHCVQNNIARELDSDFIKSSLLKGLARKVADSPDVVFRSSPADAIDDSRFAEASVCVVSAEARLTLERRHALFEAMQLRAFALLAFRDALLAVQRESVPCLTTLSMIEQRFISVVATMYIEQIKESL